MKNVTTVIRRAIEKHGFDNFQFSVLTCLEDQSLLDDAEIRAIASHNTLSPSGYNLVSGGGGCLSPSDESRKKMSESHKGKKQSAAQIAKRIAHLRGRIFSKQHRLNLSKALKGRINSLTTRTKISKALKNPPKERRQRMSDNMKRRWAKLETAQERSEFARTYRVYKSGPKNPSYGTKRTEEQKKAMSEAHLGPKNHNYGIPHTLDWKMKVKATLNEKNTKVPDGFVLPLYVNLEKDKKGEYSLARVKKPGIGTKHFGVTYGPTIEHRLKAAVAYLEEETRKMELGIASTNEKPTSKPKKIPVPDGIVLPLYATILQHAGGEPIVRVKQPSGPVVYFGEYGKTLEERVTAATAYLEEERRKIKLINPDIENLPKDIILPNHISIRRRKGREPAILVRKPGHKNREFGSSTPLKERIALAKACLAELDTIDAVKNAMEINDV
jgi:hypothetical protein